MCCNYSRLKVVHVIGKRDRPVPILLTEDVVQSIDTLIDTRQACGVPSQNKYVFGLTATTGHLRFFNVLRNVAKRAGMKKPELLTTTRMRKHVATMAQVTYL